MCTTYNYSILQVDINTFIVELVLISPLKSLVLLGFSIDHQGHQVAKASKRPVAPSAAGHGAPRR